jgi:molybdate transport system substrate-binding protein
VKPLAAGLRALALILLTLGSTTARADEARAAVASNFLQACEALAEDFHARTGHRLRISSASTGKLYAQIRAGAPFDILLSADAQTPRRLVAEGLAEAESVHDYALGRLVLWSRDPDRINDGEALLRGGDIARLAIANPALAPYGAAAREVLERLGRWEALQPALVRGENVGQAMQFVATGAAPLGLLPRSQVQEAERQARGSGWEIPADWHAPIVQSAVLLDRGRDNPAARAFSDYLRSAPARAIVLSYGYDRVD